MSRAMVLLAMIGFALGCGDDDRASAVPAARAVGFDGHECEVCGMIVREQPAPRGQLLHSDGARLYFCSVSDMVTYVQAPSPHGSVDGAWVERNDPDADDHLAYDTAALPWVSSARARFVVGIERPLVMGRAVLAYGTDEDAARVAEQLGASTADWNGLQQWRRE